MLLTGWIERAICTLKYATAISPHDRHGPCGRIRTPLEEQAVADQDPKGKKQGERQQNEENNEWLRDQVGEDKNLSGSSTFRTLPDQPTGDEDTQDDEDTRPRQSNR